MSKREKRTVRVAASLSPNENSRLMAVAGDVHGAPSLFVYQAIMARIERLEAEKAAAGKGAGE